MAEIVEPLRGMLDEGIHGGPRGTAKVAKYRNFPDSAWTEDRVRASKTAQDLVAHAINLDHPCPDFEVSMFPDAWHANWGSLLFRVRLSEYHCDIPVENMGNQPLAFLNVGRSRVRKSVV